MVCECKPVSPVRGLSPLRRDLPQQRSLDGRSKGGGDLCWNHNTEPYTTRPSALGMSDTIWGPLIHIFVDEMKIEKDKDLDQVNCEYTALRFLNF